jgi:hypothetical protein
MHSPILFIGTDRRISSFEIRILHSWDDDADYRNAVAFMASEFAFGGV